MGVAKTEPEEKQSNTGSQEKTYFRACVISNYKNCTHQYSDKLHTYGSCMHLAEFDQNRVMSHFPCVKKRIAMNLVGML